MRLLVAADTGGTFTDIVTYDPDSARIGFGKTLTTYGNLVDGVTTGLAETGVAAPAIARLRHGTTHVINAFLQRRGARTALVTTSGFRDVLQVARGNRPVPFDLFFRRDPPLIPRALSFEVVERMAHDGSVLTPLDEVSLDEAARRIAAARAEAVAVSFLNAYANPEHERQAVEFLRARLGPDVFVTSGTALTREWFEYERGSTAAANAYVGPSVRSYAEGFRKRLAAQGFGGRLSMMGSNGGVMSFDTAAERPVSLVESGPIGGVIAAAEYADALGLPRVVAFDMGGTTAKCALITDGGFEVQPTYWVGGYAHGFPLRTPVLDIIEVGAGGGSIAWVDPQGRLHVGPRSAGSEPGPVAFGRGGTEPTVTDANLVLGRIGTGNFLGGRLSLDVAAAADAIRSRIAVPLGYPDDDAAVARCAEGILDLTCTLMAGAIKEITIGRGQDVREFVLVAFGGGGPLFATDLARDLGIRRVIVPPQPGNFSAVGMLLAGNRLDLARNLVADLSASGLAMVAGALAALEQEAIAAAASEFAAAKPTVHRQLEMRYRGQRHTVLVDLPGGLSATADVRTAFEAAYATRYGRSLGEDFTPEIVGVRIVAEALTPRPSLAALGPTAREGHPSPQRRPLRLGTRWLEADVWQRDSLPAGSVLHGPAIIEEYGATSLLGPGDEGRVGTLGEIDIAVAPAAS